MSTATLTGDSALLTELRETGGFTFNPHTSQLVEYGDVTGWMIAVPGTETVLGSGDMSGAEFERAFYSAVRDAKLTDHTFVGGWYSTDRNVYMIELSELHNISKRAAIKLGIERGQEAIFGMDNGETVSLRGAKPGPWAAFHAA